MTAARPMRPPAEIQAQALANPCLVPEHTTERPIYQYVDGMSVKMTTNLRDGFVNDFGDDVPTWHVSVGRGFLISEIGQAWLQEMFSEAKALLRDVGRGEILPELGERCIHMRRRMTDAEIEESGILDA